MINDDDFCIFKGHDNIFLRFRIKNRIYSLILKSLWIYDDHGGKLNDESILISNLQSYYMPKIKYFNL